MVNGDLLCAAEANGFDAMVTADQNLEYQRQFASRKLSLVVLSANHIAVLEEQVQKLIEAVAAISIGSYEFGAIRIPA